MVALELPCLAIGLWKNKLRPSVAPRRHVFCGLAEPSCSQLPGKAAEAHPFGARLALAPQWARHCRLAAQYCTWHACFRIVVVGHFLFRAASKSPRRTNRAAMLGRWFDRV